MCFMSTSKFEEREQQSQSVQEKFLMLHLIKEEG